MISTRYLTRAEGPAFSDDANVYASSSGLTSSPPSRAENCELAEIEAAEARVLGAGDKYDLQHFINPLTGLEYSDAEVQEIYNRETVKTLTQDYDAAQATVDSIASSGASSEAAATPAEVRLALTRHRDQQKDRKSKWWQPYTLIRILSIRHRAQTTGASLIVKDNQRLSSHTRGFVFMIRLHRVLITFPLFPLLSGLAVSGCTQTHPTETTRVEKSNEADGMSNAKLAVSNEEQLCNVARQHVRDHLGWSDDEYELQTSTVHTDGGVEIWAVHISSKNATTRGGGKSVGVFVEPDTFEVLRVRQLE